MRLNGNQKAYIITSIILIVISIALIFTLNISKTNGYDDSYTIKNYVVDMSVGEDNVAQITEKITCNFSDENKHGIYRYIPLENTIKYDNGKSVTQLIEIGNLKSNTKISYSYKNKSIIIKLGDNTKYQPVGEDVVFELSYKLDMGKDYTNDCDVLYYNLLGNDCTTDIEQFTFNITMPKEFDGTKFKLLHGQAGSAQVKVLGNTIVGNLTDIKSGEAITVKMNLAENYFSKAEYIKDSVGKVLLIIISALVGGITLFYIFRKRQKHMDITLECYPPDNMNPAEMSYIYNGVVSLNDISSLIVYFASKKYLKISKNENDEIVLTKIKDLPEKAKPYETHLFGSLFRYGDSINLTTDVETFKDMQVVEGKEKTVSYDSVPQAIYNSYINANNSMSKNKRYNTINNVAYMVGFSLILLAYMLFGLGYIFTIRSSQWIYPLLPIIALVFIMIATKNLTILNKVKPKKYKIACAIVGVSWIAIYYVWSILFFKNVSYTYGYLHILIPTLLLLGTILSILTISFDDKYVVKLGRVLGFRKFLIDSEKDRLDTLIKDNPEYFYDILPYTYVLGISNEYIEKFEYLCDIPVNDYFGGDLTDVIICHHLMSARISQLSDKSIEVNTNNSSSPTGLGDGFGGGGVGSW